MIFSLFRDYGSRSLLAAGLLLMTACHDPVAEPEAVEPGASLGEKTPVKPEATPAMREARERRIAEDALLPVSESGRSVYESLRQMQEVGRVDFAKFLIFQDEVRRRLLNRVFLDLCELEPQCPMLKGWRAGEREILREGKGFEFHTTETIQDGNGTSRPGVLGMAFNRADLTPPISFQTLDLRHSYWEATYWPLDLNLRVSLLSNDPKAMAAITEVLQRWLRRADLIFGPELSLPTIQRLYREELRRRIAAKNWVGGWPLVMGLVAMRDPGAGPELIRTLEAATAANPKPLPPAPDFKVVEAVITGLGSLRIQAGVPVLLAWLELLQARGLNAGREEALKSLREIGSVEAEKRLLALAQNSSLEDDLAETLCALRGPGAVARFETPLLQAFAGAEKKSVEEQDRIAERLALLQTPKTIAALRKAAEAKNASVLSAFEMVPEQGDFLLGLLESWAADPTTEGVRQPLKYALAGQGKTMMPRLLDRLQKGGPPALEADLAETLHLLRLSLDKAKQARSPKLLTATDAQLSGDEPRLLPLATFSPETKKTFIQRYLDWLQAYLKDQEMRGEP